MFPTKNLSVQQQLGYQRGLIPRITSADLSDMGIADGSNHNAHSYKDVVLEDGDLFYNTEDHTFYYFRRSGTGDDMAGVMENIDFD